MLQWVFSDLGRMLSDGSSVDAVTQRLFPRAYLDPTEEAAEAEWQELVHDDLVESRLAAMTDVVRSLDGAAAIPELPGAREIVLGEEQAAHWIGVLNDARLAVGTALDVTAEWDFDALDPDDPEYELHALYAWMTELLGALLAAVDLGRTPGTLRFGGLPASSSLGAACSFPRPPEPARGTRSPRGGRRALRRGRERGAGRARHRPARAGRAAVGRAPPRRGHARHRQDAARQVARRRDRRPLRTGAVHARPPAGRRHRHLGVRPGDRGLGLPARPGLRQRRARRRGEPRLAAHAGRAARADGGAPGHGRRRDPPAARSVLRRRDAEPVRERGHVPAAREPARPVRARVHARAARAASPSARSSTARAESTRSTRSRRSRCPPSSRRRSPRCAACTARTPFATTCSTSPTRRATIPGIVLGASPRASLGLLRAAQAHATVMGRDFVSPDDVKQVAPAALAHRIVLAHGVDVHAGWLRRRRDRRRGRVTASLSPVDAVNGPGELTLTSIVLFTLGAYGIAAGAASGEQSVVAVGVFAFALFVLGIIWPIVTLSRRRGRRVGAGRRDGRRAATTCTCGSAAASRASSCACSIRPGEWWVTASPADGVIPRVANRRGVFRTRPRSSSARRRRSACSSARASSASTLPVELVGRAAPGRGDTLSSAQRRPGCTSACTTA